MNWSQTIFEMSKGWATPTVPCSTSVPLHHEVEYTPGEINKHFLHRKYQSNTLSSSSMEELSTKNEDLETDGEHWEDLVRRAVGETDWVCELGHEWQWRKVHSEREDVDLVANQRQVKADMCMEYWRTRMKSYHTIEKSILRIIEVKHSRKTFHMNQFWYHLEKVLTITSDFVIDESIGKSWINRILLTRRMTEELIELIDLTEEIF